MNTSSTSTTTTANPSQTTNPSSKTSTDSKQDSRPWVLQKVGKYKDEWCLPAGKTKSDFFGDDAVGKANLALFDDIRVRHHGPNKNRPNSGQRRRATKLTPLCIPYTIGLKCTASCKNAHRPQKLFNYAGSEEVSRQIDGKMKLIYKQ